MKICGLVAEFNPLHYGHLHLISQIKQQYNAVVCVLSGNFVQRGEPALLSKFARARAAVECGCDLVIELPAPYSLSTAMFFARGAVGLLHSLGVVQGLCFGSENGNMKQINAIAALLETGLYKTALKEQLQKGLPFATARQNAVGLINPAADLTLLQNPNDILGVEYCAALQALQSPITPFCVKRIGPGHNSASSFKNLASATLLRECIRTGGEYKAFLPAASLAAVEHALQTGQIASIDYLDRAIVTYLRTATAAQLQRIPDVSEGLHNKLSIAANSYATLQEIYEAVKSKRYSFARIRRIGLCGYLGIGFGMQQRPVPYCRVLGMNQTGAEVLSLAHKKATVPLIASLKEAERLGDYAEQLALLETRCGDVYSMMLQKPTRGKTDYTTKLFKTF